MIEGNRILTNAHVVSDQTFLQVRLHGRSEKHVARLVAVSHDSDLAVLSVDDPGFFEGVPPLPLGDLPEAQQRVVVCGFPMGGDTLSATAGIVSRIEQQAYAHSGVELLAVQIDAAVNPGSSDCYYEEALIDPDRMVIHFLDSEDECDIERFLTE